MSGTPCAKTMLEIPAHGYCASQKEEDYFDPALAQEFLSLFNGKTVCDLARGPGDYVDFFRRAGLQCDGFNGKSDHNLFDNRCSLNIKQDVQKRYQVAICLDVGQNVPREYETIFLNDLIRYASETIILSWAVPEQLRPDLNCRTNLYAIYQLWRRGYRFQPRWTALLRTNCSLSRFRYSLLAFSKRRSPLFSLTERTAAYRIIIADIERLNRSNSTLRGALAGYAIRGLRKWPSKGLNLLRLLCYDAATFFRREYRPVSGRQIMNSINFFPVCFTCGKHFKYFRLALFSLGKRAFPAQEISIYMDKADPLSDTECELLRSESRYPLNFQLTALPLAWAGANLILSELRAYREVAMRMGAKDYLMKFDSDVLFLSDEIFRFVATSGARAIGASVTQLHHSEGKEGDYMQGGCYFIGAKELRTIVNVPIRRAAFESITYKSLVEDKFFSLLLRRYGVKLVYNEFLYIDPILMTAGIGESELESGLKAIPPCVSVLHFEGQRGAHVDRSNMRRVAERFFVSLPPLSNPYQ